jgi:DNA-binding response OmpR family regulator
MTDRQHILIVDDDPRVRDMVRRYLGENGFDVSEAPDADAMRSTLDTERVDLVLLDLNLPVESGLTAAKRLRETSNVPIIMLTAKGEFVDRVVGLEIGADDYMTKPFHLRELLARIRSVLRRIDDRAAADGRVDASEFHSGLLYFEDFQMDLTKRELRKRGGELVPLTMSEFDLLDVLVRNVNRVVNRDQLLNQIRGPNFVANDRSIDTQIARLRKKIVLDPKTDQLIKTVRGVGYMFAAKVQGDRPRKNQAS